MHHSWRFGAIEPVEAMESNAHHPATGPFWDEEVTLNTSELIVLVFDVIPDDGNRLAVVAT